MKIASWGPGYALGGLCNNHLSGAMTHKYCLLHKNNGELRLNADGSQKIRFLINQSEKGKFQGSVFYCNSLTQTSDDRLKHNETVIDSAAALEVVGMLKPLRYQKTDEMKAADFNGKLECDYIEDAGFIAQDVAKIDALAFAVTGGELEIVDDKPIQRPFSLRYDSILTFAVAAIQKLSQDNEKLRRRLDNGGL